MLAGQWKPPWGQQKRAYISVADTDVYRDAKPGLPAVLSDRSRSHPASSRAAPFLSLRTLLSQRTGSKSALAYVIVLTHG
jgi:hypothetical protein